MKGSEKRPGGRRRWSAPEVEEPEGSKERAEEGRREG